jgi:hypothetical protein
MSRSIEIRHLVIPGTLGATLTIDRWQAVVDNGYTEFQLSRGAVNYTYNYTYLGEPRLTLEEACSDALTFILQELDGHDHD